MTWPNDEREEYLALEYLREEHIRAALKRSTDSDDKPMAELITARALLELLRIS